MDVAALIGVWPALTPAPQRITPLTQGASNTLYLIDADGGRYVLHIYRNHADIAAWMPNVDPLRIATSGCPHHPSAHRRR